MKKRVHLVTAVNARNVSKEGDLFVIRNTCGAVDDIVMNRVRYPGKELKNGAPSLSDRIAPIGHPKNAAGQYISANSGDALLTAYAGAICRNGRHEGGRTLVDLHINAAMAKAHPKGAEVVNWCEAAINGEDPPPMHVSTGLLADMVDERGEVNGKAYDRVATNIRYDHLALLPGGLGAGTPEQGVGMFNDGTDTLQQVETIVVNVEGEDRRFEGLTGWLRKLLANSSDLSFEQIRDGLHKALPEGAWVREVFARYAVWYDRDGKLWKQDYAVSDDGSVAFFGTAQEVREQREYEPVNNLQRDPMKDMIVNALRAAGISTEGLSDQALVDAYNAHVRAMAVAPVQEKLDAANAQLQTLQANAQQAEAAELATLATELAANSQGTLTADDFKAMGLKRCRELKAANKAAPVVPGSPVGNQADEFASYDPNASIDAALNQRKA